MCLSDADRRDPKGVSERTMNVDALMAQVRVEVARRRAGGGDVPKQPTEGMPRVTRSEPLPRWQPAAPRLPDKPEYVVGDFLRFDDSDFVDVAYEKLLKRPTDAAGREGYLDALRSGVISKIEILGLIRFSDEGRRQAVHVDGLLLPYKLHRWRHVRVVGWLLGMGMALARLPRLALRLQSIEASSARETEGIARLLGQIEDELERRFANVAQATAARVEGLRAVAARVDGVRAELESTRVAQQASLEAGLAEQARKNGEAATRLAAHDAALARLDEQASGDQRAVRAMLDRLTIFLDASARRARGGADTGDDVAEPESQYASFEHTFRGEREEIKQRAAHYLDTLASAGIAPGDLEVVLDLGSGRGEWLEVLAERGYRGRGVDTNRGMLETSRARGHDVVEADALDYLRAQADGSFAAVTSMHMVEHIPHPAVVRLLDEALRVLRPGGLLILETPNPENVLVGSCMFYMDPTHLHPIPPLLLQWSVQARGFEDVRVERLSEHRGAPALVRVSDDVPGAAQINQMVAWFTAPPDYAVIARKRARK